MKYLENEGYYVNRHACFLLQYHLVFVTKYRNKVIKGELKESLYAYIHKYFKDRGLNLIELNGEEDHVHLLFEAPPQINLAEFINALKSASSRRMRTDHKNYLSQYYWKPYFWSFSYFICTVSDRSVTAVQNYIRNQTVG